jgi:branched-chain amino acid transport system substrate-binding protein
MASDGDPPQVIVNDSIRTAATIQQLSNEFRDRLTGVAPLATTSDAPSPFTAHTIDCVNLLALAAERAGTDDPDEIKIRMPSVSGGGRQCTSFETCIALLDQGLQIDYNGESGSIELSTVSGDPTRATFVTFGFDVDGSEIDTQTLEVP